MENVHDVNCIMQIYVIFFQKDCADFFFQGFVYAVSRVNACSKIGVI